MSLSSQRQESLEQLSGSITVQYNTGHMMLDSILHLSSQQAQKFGISLSVDIDDTFFCTIFSHIDEEQTSHILADLLQNAIIATKNSSHKEITVSLVSNGNTPSIQVSDTGVAFPTVVLNELGKCRCSQHLNEGGTGIGLMDIWTLKSTARATLLIEEFPTGATYTKRINIVFDAKNRYIIMSDRKIELTSQLSRTDVFIYPPQ